MEKVIGLLFDIEKKANQIIERADLEKKQLLEENENAITRMEEKIAEENTARINALTAKAEEEFEKEKQQLKDNSEKQLQELMNNESSVHDTYVKNIFEYIIHD